MNVKFPSGTTVHRAGSTRYVTACGIQSTAQPKQTWAETSEQLTCAWCKPPSTHRKVNTLSTLNAKTDITLTVTLTVRLEADAGVPQIKVDEHVAEHLERIRDQLTEKVTLKADFWQEYVTDNDQLYVDDVVKVERPA